MIKVGILGAAGYTGGELIRLLLNHPEAEIVFANSESNAGNLVSDVHEGLLGDTELRFTDEMPFDQVDVVFFCFGHGKSEAFLKEHTIPENVKIIDLAQDFRIKGSHDYVYGLPEINKEQIQQAQHLANPGCFATAIQLALLPAAMLHLLKEDVAVNAITGSTGAGQKPGATTHFSWRVDNLSIYKPFQHQHIAEIRQSLTQEQGYLDASIDFILAISPAAFSAPPSSRPMHPPATSLLPTRNTTAMLLSPIIATSPLTSSKWLTPTRHWCMSMVSRARFSLPRALTTF